MINHHKERRQRLEQSLSGSPIVLTAYDAMQLSGDMATPFRQEASFYYLTGIDEPGWLLVISRGNSYLIMPNISESGRLFDGGYSRSRALEISDVDQVLTKQEGRNLLKELASGSKVVYTLGRSVQEKYYTFHKNPSQAKLNRRLKNLFENIKDCRSQINRMRAIKSEHEISLIEKATSITHKAFDKVYGLIKNVKHEYEIEAMLSAEFRASGADGHSYTPIVAGGANALTLHYTKNNSVLPEKGFVLIDAGAMIDGYVSDITRTYTTGPITEYERAAHQAIESAEKDIISLIKPGLSFADYQNEVDAIMKRKLDELNLIKSSSDYRRYFPHAVSHGIGIDVHESLGGHTEFKEGMVVTVEPGVYIPESNTGIRIEDMVLVTKTGSRVMGTGLSTNC